MSRVRKELKINEKKHVDIVSNDTYIMKLQSKDCDVF